MRADVAGNTDSYFGRLIGELQRRRVLRTAALYIVGAWLAMQVADVVFPALGISEQSMRFVLFGAVLGFPVALVFGWFYDLSAHGIRRTEAADADASVGPQALRRTDYVILSALGIVVFAILYNAVGNVVEAPRDRWEQDQDGPPMVAVLPFVSAGLGENSEFFATGVHDDLLTQLAHLQSIRVISRTSVMEYKDVVHNIREIGRALGADAILEGGVQSAGDRIRINAQLIDARTDEHLWAATYDRELTAANIFEVQTEIARAITSAMRAALTEQDTTLLAEIPTENMAAYRVYHRAMEMRANFEGKTEDIVALLEDAVDVDPGFTRAWAEMVGSLAILGFGDRDPELTRRAEAALETIRSIAPESADYVIAQTYYTYYILQDYDQALQLVTKAHDMIPSDASLLGLKSWIHRRRGDYVGVVEALKAARKIDPRNPRWTDTLTNNLLASHHYDEARELAEQSEFHDYWTHNTRVFLRLMEHRDFGRWAQEVAALQEEFEEDAAPSALWMARIANREYLAAEELLADLRETGDVSLGIERFTSGLPAELITYWMLQRDEQLTIKLQQLRLLLEPARESASENERDRFDLGFALLAAAQGDREETVRLVNRWRRGTSSDLAERVRSFDAACEFLGMAGATDETVECLRTALVEPSYVMPFFEPYLPFYDSIRNEPAFVELLVEIEDGLGYSQQ